MFGKIVLASVLIATASQSTALSCLRPHVATSFHNASQSDDVYSVVHGRFTFDENLLPRFPAQPGQRVDPITARFQGQSLSNEGFVQPVQTQITLQPACAGSWCGQLTSGQQVLAFVQHDDRMGLTLTLDPCSWSVFPEPDREDLQQVVACIQGATCLATHQ